MKQKSSSQAAFFSRRAVVAAAFASLGISLGLFSFASTPGTSTITVPATAGQKVTVTWSGAIPAGVNGTSDCADLAATPLVDVHMPTINAPANYGNLKAKFTFNIKWDGASGNDEILTVVNPDGSELDSSDGGDPSETVTADNLSSGTYKVVACGFISGPDPQPYTGTLTIDTATGAPPPPSTPAPTPAIPGGPRYLNYAAPPAVGENAGEPSIGYNLTTHKALYIAGLQTLRISFPENPTPEACDANWEDISSVITRTKSLDPILFTDQRTGRTFVSQLDSVVPPAGNVLIGLNSLMAYSDDDGASWIPAQINPPDGSYDHQTVGAGPYPASLPLANPVNKGDAVYYCAQAGYTAFCSRSDDGGLNFGRATAVYTAISPIGTACGGIHGHVKVAPDGTVYLPNGSCDGTQGMAVSTDAGTTWMVHQITGSTAAPAILDPSIGIASDGTVYFAYINGDGHAHVAVSHDRGNTWVNDRDIGAAHNIGNAVFVEAVAGDPDRAAVGFLGTTQTGDHEAADFNGSWYLYMAHTYDGGDHWLTVNATPNGPVQREACIWNSGGSNLCRNLLDFNEITMDEKGRILYSYSDGCVGECENGGSNSYTSKATIARQSGGKGLLGQYDSPEPVAPQAACLSGRRDDQGSYLTWIAPDNGGSDITSYKILRSDAQHAEAQIGTQVGYKTTFTDRSADPSVAQYTYRIVAVNSINSLPTAGPPSNGVDLTVGPRPPITGSCALPGIQLFTDPLGDSADSAATPQHDITSVSVAEPLDDAVTGSASKIYFTIKVASLSGPIAPGWRWSIRFTVPGYPAPNTPTGDAQEDWHVSMVTSDNAAPAFTYGTTGSFQPGGLDLPARFFTTIGNLDPASAYNADGTITLVLPKSVFPGIADGTAINVALASVRATGPSAIPETGGTNETIPDITGPGSYHTRAANLCLPNAAPLAVLTSDIQSGPQGATVNFDGSLSHDTDAIDTVSKFTFNFGDGGDDVVQVGDATISHSFPNAGTYDVKLVVTDSRGKISDNTAHRIIQIQQPFGLASVVSRKTHGNAAFDIDLPLTGTAGVECRVPGANNSYQLVYTFNRDVTVAGTPALAPGNTGAATAVLGPQSNQVTVNLTGVTNIQRLIVNLGGVKTAANEVLNGLSARMGVLIGDVNGSGVVTTGDTNLCKAQALQPVTVTNFRNDINATGAVTTGDANLIKQHALDQLP